MFDEKFQMMRAIAALEMGIIPLDISVSEALKNMSPEEARKIKRKFRKVRRKLAKKKIPPHRPTEGLVKYVTKSDVHREVDRLARELLK